MIVGPGRTFDGASEAAARLALSHARFLGREMGLLSLRVLQSVKVGYANQPAVRASPLG
jgi:hypothetical protein